MEATEQTHLPQTATSRSIIPRDFEEAWRFADMISKSELAPKDYRNKPTNAMCAIIMGLEVGLSPMQAVQNIAVINGKPSLYGDAMLAVVQNHPAFEYISEDFDELTMTASCTVKRKGGEPHTATFSKADAETAGLWNKPGPWTQYPKRMLQMRARGFGVRDQFADALRGLNSREEQQDIVDITAMASHTAPAPREMPDAEPSEPPAADFEQYPAATKEDDHPAETGHAEAGEPKKRGRSKKEPEPGMFSLALLQEQLQGAATFGTEALDGAWDGIKGQYEGQGTDEEWLALQAEYEELRN